MNYWKRIPISYYNTIVEKSLAYIKTQDRVYLRQIESASWYDLNFEEYREAVPEVMRAFDRYLINCMYAAAYVMYDPDHVLPHIDSYPAKARINLPLQNCSGTYTNFYTGGGVEEWINPGSGVVSYMVHDQENLTLVDKVEMTEATVLRTSAIHSVTLPAGNPIPRVTLTLGFDRDPVFLLI